MGCPRTPHGLPRTSYGLSSLWKIGGVCMGCPWECSWTVRRAPGTRELSADSPWAPMASPWAGRGQSVHSPWTARGVSIDSPSTAHPTDADGHPTDCPWTVSRLSLDDTPWAPHAHPIDCPPTGESVDGQWGLRRQSVWYPWTVRGVCMGFPWRVSMDSPWTVREQSVDSQWGAHE